MVLCSCLAVCLACKRSRVVALPCFRSMPWWPAHQRSATKPPKPPQMNASGSWWRKVGQVFACIWTCNLYPLPFSHDCCLCLITMWTFYCCLCGFFACFLANVKQNKLLTRLLSLPENFHQSVSYSTRLTFCASLSQVSTMPTLVVWCSRIPLCLPEVHRINDNTDRLLWWCCCCCCCFPHKHFVWCLFADGRFIFPTVDRFSLQLFSPTTWEPIPNTK